MTTGIDFEQIAAQIHQFYCDLAIAQGWKNDFPMPFAELPEFMKVDNRAAAQRIPQVLALAGLRLVPRNGQPWTDEEQTEMRNLIEQKEYLDLLAEGEHDGWTQARLRQDWRVGPCKDVSQRQSHLLVPWSQFPAQVEQKQKKAGPARKSDGTPMTVDEEVEAEKNKDRESVHNYVAIIAQTAYRIAREE